MDHHVLLVSTDDRVRHQVDNACRQLDLALNVARGLAEARTELEQTIPAVALYDVEASPESRFPAFDELRRDHPGLCVILIAERTRSDQAIEAMKHGAIDYLLKPLNHNELVAHITSALRISRDMTVPTVYRSDDHDDPSDYIIGQSPAMHEVFKLIGLIAPRDVNVLITGESGTGKELVAKALYQHSQRKEQPFLAVNCAAIPETLLESELFGHEKGAFTGAEVRRIGKFEQCNGGTLFLDEIGDLPLATQAKLLRVLQDGSFHRLGSAKAIHADVRIITATNQPLETLIAERRFREDLYYRLKVTSIELPPLREREVDAVLLAHYFVKRFNRAMGTEVQRFAPEVLPALLSYPWPGNVRELENVIKASLVMARGKVFQLDFLPEKIRHAQRRVPGQPPTEPTGSLAVPDSPSTPPSPPPAEPNSLRQACRELARTQEHQGMVYRKAVELAEREAIRTCLEITSGQIAPAARMLGITRTTLRRKMTELGIQINTLIQSDK